MEPADATRDTLTGVDAENPHARGERGALVSRLASHVVTMETATLPAAVRSLLSTDLTIQQLKVLTVLVTATRGATVRDLASTFSVSMASMSTMLDRLVNQGTARREVDPHDLRMRRIHATDVGRDVVQKLVGARPEFAEAVLSRLSVDDLRALEQGMRALSAALDAVAGESGEGGAERAGE